jgi:hypothetical protein
LQWHASQAPLEALRLALDPSTIHPIDVALVNGEVFMNLATAGPVSEVSSKGMSDALKKLLGPAAVAVAGGCAAVYTVEQSTPWFILFIYSLAGLRAGAGKAAAVTVEVRAQPRSGCALRCLLPASQA